MRKGKYFTIKYDEAKDEFQIWLNTDDPENEDEWGYCLGCRCMKRVEEGTGREYADAEFIHYSILTKVRDLLNQGWKYY